MAHNLLVLWIDLYAHLLLVRLINLVGIADVSALYRFSSDIIYYEAYEEQLISPDKTCCFAFLSAN